MAAGNGVFLSVPIRLPDGDGGAGDSTITSIEVQMRSGVKVSLHGMPAERAIAAVMRELVAER